MGETRHRIKEFHAYTIPVLGLREGSWLKVDGDQIIVKGFSARLFKQIRSLKSLKPELISVTSNKTKQLSFSFEEQQASRSADNKLGKNKLTLYKLEQ
jgi:hypothetical protein